MGDFCIDLLSNLQVTNTTLESGVKSIFKFSTPEDKLRVQIQRMGEEQNEVAILEEMTIESARSAQRRKGMVIDRVYLRACDSRSGSDNAYLRRQSL